MLSKSAFIRSSLAVALALLPQSGAAQAEYAWHKGDGSIYFGEKDSPEDIGLLFHCEEAGKWACSSPGRKASSGPIKR
jgi:hypothetical protein